MGRSIAGVVVGVIVGAVLVLIVEFIGHRAFPPMTPLDVGDANAVKALPLGAKVALLIAWAAGAFGGGAAALIIAKRWAPVAWLVAATILLFAASNFLSFAHPLWMVIGSVPAAALGGWLAIIATRADYRSPRPPAKTLIL